MGWAESPPYFCAVTETVADVANTRLQDPTYTPPAHKLDEMASSITVDEPAQPQQVQTASSVPLPPVADPSLHSGDSRPLQYVDIFVDDFISAAQRPFLWRVQRTLMHAIDDVF